MLYPDVHIKPITDTKFKPGDRVFLKDLIGEAGDVGTVREILLFQEPMSETEQIVYGVKWDADNEDDYFTGDQLDPLKLN